jgi:hypothetical protein
MTQGEPQPQAPSLAPPHALCAQCAYSLRGLPRDAHCPECNHPVAESVRALPGTAVLRGQGTLLRTSVLWAERWLSAWLILVFVQVFTLAGLSIIGVPRAPAEVALRALSLACVLGHSWSVLRIIATRPANLAMDPRAARALRASCLLWPIAAGASAVIAAISTLGVLPLPVLLAESVPDLSRACFLLHAWALSSFLGPIAGALALPKEVARLRTLAKTSLALLGAIGVAKIAEHTPSPFAHVVATLAKVFWALGSAWVVFAFAVILSKFRKELDNLLAGIAPRVQENPAPPPPSIPPASLPPAPPNPGLSGVR